MQYIPVKTRIFQPPQDDLFAVLDESLADVREGDIVAISSKVVAIHEGNCLPVEGVDKKELVAQEAELCIPRTYWSSPLTIKHSAFIGTAGIDESNADGHYILLPQNPFISAKNIHHYLTSRFHIKNVGVVITDSHSSPLRRGAMGVAIGWWGFKPTINHVGKPDLFGRDFRIEVSNIADALAAGAGLVMGETNECQPVVIIRGTPDMTFVDTDTKDELFVSFEDDTFRVLYEDFLT
jgi:dihydrofolate synthase / folylpolyglutamate synthase